MFLCDKCGSNTGATSAEGKYDEHRHCGCCGKKSDCKLYPTVTVDNMDGAK